MRTRVFVSYCHADTKWLDAIREQLKVLETEGLLDIYEDTKLEAGEAWYDKLHQEMQSAKLALLLVSAPFLASKFIRNEEVPRLFGRHANGGMLLYPLLVRPCPFEHVPWLARLQLRPQDSMRRPRAISALSGAAREQVLVDIANEIATICSTKQSITSKNNIVVDHPFKSWVVFSSVGRIHGTTEQFLDEFGHNAIRISAKGNELSGISKSLNSISGTVSFYYRVESIYTSPNIFFYVIPVREAITGSEGIVEVGARHQDDIRNEFSPFRARYSPAPQDYADGAWHAAKLTFDFRYLHEAFYSIFAVRINEGAVDRRPGIISLRDVEFSLAA